MTRVPESWADVVAGTPIDGSVETVSAAGGFANRVNQDAGYFGIRVQEAVRVTNGLTSGAVSLIRAKLEGTLLPGAAALLDSSWAMKAALADYASEVDRIHAEARRLAESIDHQLALIRPEAASIDSIAREIGVHGSYPWDAGAPATMPMLEVRSRSDGSSNEAEIARLVNEHEAAWWRAATLWQAAIGEVVSARRRWSDLIEERAAAELRLVGSLQETVIGQLITLTAGSREQQRSTIALWVSGEMWGIAAESPQLATSHPLLEQLIGRTDGSDIWDDPGNPETIAANWAALDESEREALIAAVPWVIGNLPGLSAEVRHRANQLQVDFYREYPHLLSLPQLKLMLQLQNTLGRARGQADPDPPMFLVSLDAESTVPMVAVAYGNPDTSTHTVWLVPGMNGDAPDGLVGLNDASRNLYRVQKDLLNGRGQSAVIAWLGYDTPGQPISGWGVLGSEDAIRGARRLAVELDGEYASRAAGEHGLPTRSPLGYSYGSTTASIALTMTTYPVDNFIMIGSAGLDVKIVPNLYVLNVAEVSPGQKAIYTTVAQNDWIAATGSDLAGRGQPNPDAPGGFGIPGYRTVYDGALVFSSAGEPEQGSTATDGHALIGGGEKVETGYMGEQTQALKTIARITTGILGQELSVSPTEPAGFVERLRALVDARAMPIRAGGER